MQDPAQKSSVQPAKPAGFGFIAIALLCAPFAGIVVRLWTANAFVLAVAGIAIWLVVIAGAALMLRRATAAAGIPLGQHLTVWSIEFAALYFVSVVVTAHMLRR